MLLNIFNFSFLKLYFIVCTITVVPHFPSLSPSTPSPHSLRQSPHHCPFPCPWVMNTHSLATLFSMLYFIPPWLFCNYQFVHINPFTFFTHSPTSLPSSNHENVLCIYDSISILLVYLLFLDSLVFRYIFIATSFFIFLISLFFLKKIL